MNAFRSTFVCVLVALAGTAWCAGCRRPPSGPGPEDDPRGHGRPVVMPESTNRYSDLRQHTFSRNGADSDPELAPDLKRLLLASSVHGRTYNLHEKEIDAPTVSLFTDDPLDERFPRFSPDGKWVVFSANRDGNWDIFRKPDTSRGEWVAIVTDPEDELWPTWSPDGGSVAYCELFPDGWMLRTIDARGKKTDLCPGLLPTWHPSKPVIAFQRARGRDEPWYAIWLVDVNSGRQTELVSGPDWAAINPTWSPDGRWLLFATVHKSASAQAVGREIYGDDFWVVPEAGGMAIALTDDSEPKWNPTWGRDGRVYFISKRSGTPNVWSLQPILPKRE